METYTQQHYLSKIQTSQEQTLHILESLLLERETMRNKREKIKTMNLALHKQASVYRYDSLNSIHLSSGKKVKYEFKE